MGRWSGKGVGSLMIWGCISNSKSKNRGLAWNALWMSFADPFQAGWCWVKCCAPDFVALHYARGFAAGFCAVDLSLRDATGDGKESRIDVKFRNAAYPHVEACQGCRLPRGSPSLRKAEQRPFAVFRRDGSNTESKAAGDEVAVAKHLGNHQCGHTGRPKTCLNAATG